MPRQQGVALGIAPRQEPPVLARCYLSRGKSGVMMFIRLRLPQPEDRPPARTGDCRAMEAIPCRPHNPSREASAGELSKVRRRRRMERCQRMGGGRSGGWKFPGLEFRLQAVRWPNRLKPGLQTPDRLKTELRAGASPRASGPSSMGMHSLRCKSPAMVVKEALANGDALRLIAPSACLGRSRDPG